MSEFGYAGKILKVDLTSGKISILPSAEYTSRFVGGRGLAAKLFGILSLRKPGLSTLLIVWSLLPVRLPDLPVWQAAGGRFVPNPRLWNLRSSLMPI